MQTLPATKQFPADKAQQLREAMLRIEATTVALTTSPGEASEQAHFEACKAMAKLMPMMPHFARAQDNKICELIGLVLGILPDLPDAIAAIMTKGLIEIAPDEYAGMKQAIEVYAGKVQGNA